MRKIIIVFFTFFVGLQLIAQNLSSFKDDKIYEYRQKAEPKEGMQIFYDDFIERLNKELLLPSDKKVRFKIEFIVEKDGSFNEIQVKGDDAKVIGERVVRVLKTMPAWNPAELKGKIVRSTFVLSIGFEKLETIEMKSDKKFDNLVLDTLVETDDFEFKCNCSFLNKHTNSKIHQTAVSYTLNDYEGAYSVIIQRNVKKRNISDFDELMDDDGLRGEKKFIELNGIKAFQISNDSQLYGDYNTLIFLVSNNKLINIQVNTENKVLTEYLVDDLKKTFRLKK